MKTISKSKLLIAEPFSQDPFFKRTVCIITEHNIKGSMGFILNRPINLSINEAIMGFPEVEFTPFFGGPIGKDSLFYIHTYPNIENSISLTKDVFIGGDFNHITDIVLKDKSAQKRIKFFIGYAGWSPGQLENEISEGSWIIAPFNRNMLFSLESKSLWKKAVTTLGDKFSLVANFPENPSYN